MSSYIQTQSVGFKSQNVIEDVSSSNSPSAGKYTSEMDIEQLYWYFDSVKTPVKREPTSFQRNGNCTIHSLIK